MRTKQQVTGKISRRLRLAMGVSLMVSGCMGATIGGIVYARAADSVVNGEASLATKSCRDVLGSATREALCSAVNKSRASKGRASLKLDAALSRVAQKHAEDMAKQGYFSHQSPDGGTMVSRLEDAGLDYGYAGENIARGQDSVGDVMESWMNSAGHRKNILNPNFKKIGIGLYDEHWVQVFTD